MGFSIANLWKLCEPSLIMADPELLAMVAEGTMSELSPEARSQVVAMAVVLNKMSVGEVPAKLAYKCFKKQDQPLQEVRRTVNAATQAEEGLVAVCQTLSQTIS